MQSNLNLEPDIRDAVHAVRVQAWSVAEACQRFGVDRDLLEHRIHTARAVDARRTAAIARIRAESAQNTPSEARK